MRQGPSIHCGLLISSVALLLPSFEAAEQKVRLLLANSIDPLIQG